MMKSNHRLRVVAVCLAVTGLSGCLLEEGSLSTQLEQDPLDQALREQIDQMALTGDPTLALVGPLAPLTKAGDGTGMPDISAPKAQLGKLLFFTKALGGDLDVACASCHHPMLGGGDNLSLPIGTETVDPDLLGPGRLHRSTGEKFDGGPTVPRNAPTTFNLACWQESLFHDGRLQTLAPGGIRTPDSLFGVADPLAGANLAVAQARFPVTSSEEMRGFEFVKDGDNAALREQLTQRLRGATGELPVDAWLPHFQAGFEQPEGTVEELVTFANVVDAIGEYERSQLFYETPWKAYVEGNNNALSSSAKRGAMLFLSSVDEGGAGCAACHSGDFFTDEGFHNIAMVQIGRGKGDGITGTDDLGRFRETGLEADRYAFRTPGLLNVEVTGPWGHSGAYTTLEGVIRHHGSPRAALMDYDYGQLTQGEQVEDLLLNSTRALNALEQAQREGSSLLPQRVLTDTEVFELAEFLRALTDPCVKSRACLAPWIPNDSDPDPDGLRLRAVDESGNPL